ncbi:hypothetical protein GW17_00037706 [Ensete ventricosum]|nr:hypothetical protein GW17_00037706 [Ensete ventricosum]
MSPSPLLLVTSDEEKNMVSFISSSVALDEDVEGRRCLQPSAKKKPHNRKRGNEGDRVFRCSSRCLAVISWIRIIEGGQH